MKAECEWIEGLAFESKMGMHTIRMDTRSPLGKDSGPSPKQLLLSAVAGCTAMDVVALLKKNKQALTKLSVHAEAEPLKTYPAIFPEIRLHFWLEGEVEPAFAIEAVELSQSKYCGVSAMVAKTSPLVFVVELNGKEIHRGHAKFPL